MPPHFSAGKIPTKNWTEEKPPQYTPETQPHAYYYIGKAPSRPNCRVPANTMEKQSNQNVGKSVRTSSPLVMKLSNHSGSAELN
mmetsp:Transcript_15490/g.20985  ORF Transcript_15490/g.20985 Transcript_15490/m.20985 type:complete len:84 (+) Transcript_15490:586-837(+)